MVFSGTIGAPPARRSIACNQEPPTAAAGGGGGGGAREGVGESCHLGILVAVQEKSDKNDRILGRPEKDMRCSEMVEVVE